MLRYWGFFSLCYIDLLGSVAKGVLAFSGFSGRLLFDMGKFACILLVGARLTFLEVLTIFFICGYYLRKLAFGVEIGIFFCLGW